MTSSTNQECKEKEKAANYAVVAITKHGVKLARTKLATFENSDLYYPNKFAKGDEASLGITLVEGSTRELVASLFKKYQGIIFIFSIGAVVRLIAPLLEDKKKDPAIVVIDEQGNYVISVLSGHIGRANQITSELAELINATPIITTASDLQKTISVDLLGRKFGWEWETADHLTVVSAAIVNEESVALVQESGEKNWWKYDTPLPKNISLFTSIKEAIKIKPGAAIIVTHRILAIEEKQLLNNGVLYRPKVIVLGIGCNRGTSANEIEAVIEETLLNLQIDKKSVKTVATIDLKKDEQGLLEVVKKNYWNFVYYTPEELNSVEIREPSETVFNYTGAYGVSEPAAKLASSNNDLLLYKQKSGNVTISIGMLDY